MKNKKKDGFEAQKAIVLPRRAIQQCEVNAITMPLHLTDIGFYPKAKFHYRVRPQGSPQNILIYCVDGEGWAEIEGLRTTVLQGQYLIVPQNVKHVYGASDDKPWSIFWLHFKGENAGAYVHLLKKTANNFSANIGFSNDRVKLFNEMYNALQAGYSLDNLCYVNLTLYYYLATFCYANIFTPPPRYEEDEIDKVIKYMQDNVSKILTLQDLASYTHRSASHFSALFKHKTGYPPLEYFNHIKIQRACQLLEFSNMQIKELTYTLGFNDPFYFSRLFSKVMGLSPIDYRKKKKF